MTRPFFQRIAAAAIEKKSPIVLALDPIPRGNQRLPELAAKTICEVEHHVCAVKMNFHIILPLSASQILRINKLAHSFGLQSIADIKLNDIETTNAVAGIIALVYMSHPEAKEGFGLKIQGRGLYKTFFERAETAGVDGIVVGATQDQILKEAAGRLPVYSPGVGTQGGDAGQAIRNGADYLIIGRSIVEARQPAKVAGEIQNRILSIGK